MRVVTTMALMAMWAGLAVAQDLGQPAPPIDCDAWVSVQKGEQPSLGKLKGKLVLLEFWFTT